MNLRWLFRRGSKADRRAVSAVYGEIVGRARDPVFFGRFGVPDTLDGRFETLALHAFLVLGRLRSEPAHSADFAQALFDAMFLDLDRGLRELGAADLGVGRRVKTMIEAFYGRSQAYEEGLAGGDRELQRALRRNLYGTVEPAEFEIAAMADYLKCQHVALSQLPIADLITGRFRFQPFDQLEFRAPIG